MARQPEAMHIAETRARSHVVEFGKENSEGYEFKHVALEFVCVRNHLAYTNISMLPFFAWIFAKSLGEY